MADESVYDGALFVQMRTRPPGAGPFAPLLTAAGWASASQRRWGSGWVLTANGSKEPEEARLMASVADDEVRLGLTRHLPQPLVTLAKDVRTAVRGALTGRAPSGPWMGRRVPFVWQRHDPFQFTGARLAQQLRCPLVMAVHAIHVDEARGWGVKRPVWGDVLRQAEVRLIDRADLIACVSDEMARDVQRLLPQRAADVITIGSGIDNTHFRPDDELRKKRRAALGFSADDIVIGWHGSFRKFHGLDTLIGALPRVLAAVPHARVLLVGHGVHRDRLLARAAALGVRDRLLCPGEVPYGQIPEYLNAMDIGVVLADQGDAFHYSPLKLYEYQASGLPIVASSAGELKRLEDGVDARLVDAGDIAQLAATLISLAGDANARRLMGASARRLGSAHTWERKLDNLMVALNLRGHLRAAE